MPDRTVLTVEWLREHPHSSAREVAAGTGLSYKDARYIYALLESAEREGWVQRSRLASGPWLWEAVILRDA